MHRSVPLKTDLCQEYDVFSVHLRYPRVKDHMFSSHIIQDKKKKKKRLEKEHDGD